MTALLTRLSQRDIADARTRWDVITADVALKRQGRELKGLCPFHAERTPSFYVVPDKGFYQCFGCGAHGNVIDYVMLTRNLEFVEAVDHINGTAMRQPPRRDPAPYTPPARQARDDKTSEIEALLRTCSAVGPTTAAYLYLYLRGLTDAVHRAPVQAAQAALRAHPSLYCHELGKPMSALVAPITSSHGVTAVQRIWVSDRVETVNGVGPKDSRAPLTIRKKTLGEMHDGAVRMGAPRDRLGLAEGVETAIAAAIVNRGMPVWATCGGTRMGGVAIPEGVTMVRIYGDNGPNGAALAERAAAAYEHDGYRTEIRYPLAHFGDFNDQLLAEETVR